MGWYGFKEWLEATSGLDMDALHVHAGILVQLLAALLFRRSLRSIWPWFIVFVASLANEGYDLWFETWPDPERARQFAEGAKDLLNTMLIPTLLLLVARFAPRLLTGASSRVEADQEAVP
jgi:hypothetical protein